MMHPLRVLVSLAAALLLGLTGCNDSTDSTSGTLPEPHPSGDASTVVTRLFAFEPEDLTVPAGTTVTWTVDDGIAHTVTTGTFTLGGDGLRSAQNPDGLIDMPLSRGHQVTFTFHQAGTYTYFCSIHKGMTGTITVTS